MSKTYEHTSPRRSLFRERHPSGIRLVQEGLNSGFGLGIRPLADVLVAKVTALVDQVQRRPVVVVVGAPGGAFVVLRYGVCTPSWSTA